MEKGPLGHGALPYQAKITGKLQRTQRSQRQVKRASQHVKMRKVRSATVISTYKALAITKYYVFFFFTYSLNKSQYIKYS